VVDGAHARPLPRALLELVERAGEISGRRPGLHLAAARHQGDRRLVGAGYEQHRAPDKALEDGILGVLPLQGAREVSQAEGDVVLWCDPVVQVVPVVNRHDGSQV
jgi:hypothetical protein